MKERTGKNGICKWFQFQKQFNENFNLFPEKYEYVYIIFLRYIPLSFVRFSITVLNKYLAMAAKVNK